MISQLTEIIPGILEKDFTRIIERVKLVAPFVEWIQIDIADNKLVPNETILDPSPFQKLIEETGKKFELHMMTDNPLELVDGWIHAGFKRVLLHVEGFKTQGLKDSRTQSKIQNIKAQGVEVGLALDKETSVEAIVPYLDTIDCVLVMTIKAGFSGQSFIPEMLEKVKVLRSMKKDLPIEVDGGINSETAKLAVAAGVNRLAATSYIYNSENIGEAIWTLKNLKPSQN